MAVVRDFTALTGSNQGSWLYVQGAAGYASGPLLLTFSFPTAAPEAAAIKLGASAAATFAPFTESEKTAARAALQQWADASGLQFLEVAGERGDLRFSWYDFNTTPEFSSFGGIGFSPYTSFAIATSGRVSPVSEEYWFKQNVPYDIGGDTYYNLNNRARAADPSAFTKLLLHEIGHAIGLKHPHEGDPVLAVDADTVANTVMSYSAGRTDRLGPLDIAAVQALYGPASGDGTQFAGFSFDAATQRTHFVFGGNADLIRGTSTNDLIDAGPGNDAIFASYGNDTITGGPGLDNATGGRGLDTYVTGLAWSDRAGLTYAASGPSTLRVPEGTEFISDVERFVFGDRVLAFDLDGTAGQGYRLYQAAFARTPDVPGLSYWVKQMDAGLPLREAARLFLLTPEAQSVYGTAPTATQLVNKLYLNVLGRAGEPAGASFWISQIETNARDRAGVLADFAQSPENIALVGVRIGSGIELLDSVAFG